MSKIVGVVFDFDGTLVQSNEIKKETYYLAAKDVGCPFEIVDQTLADIPRGDRHQLIGAMAAEMQSQNLLGPGVLPQHFALDFTSLYSELCEAAISTCPEVEGASDTLRELRHRNIEVFLNSATPKNYLERIARNRSFFGEVSAIYGAPTAKADNNNAILDSLKCTASEIMFVGDGQDDLEAATKTGCHFTGIRGGRGKFSVETFPTVADLRQLLPLIDNIDCQSSNVPMATGTSI
jgi:phosphoglycolate phosphatase